MDTGYSEKDWIEKEFNSLADESNSINGIDL
jgi:hypothetical protein